jgi:hypothetical protein
MPYTTHQDAHDSQAAGNTQASAAARSASHHQPMNPQKVPGENVLHHTLARMLPLHRYQQQVYRLGQKYPPGLEDGFSPIWECATALLPARQTTQLRINFQREFHLLAMSASSSLAGGFRAQIYDMKKNYGQGKPGVRLAARGVNQANYFGPGSGPIFLREPHPFTEPNAQALVIIQNQDTSGASNVIQVVLFGMARRFNFPG